MDTSQNGILYFYIKKGISAKAHVWSRPKLILTKADMGGNRILTCCQVAEYYVGHRLWDTEALTEHMNLILTEQEGEDYYLQPQLAELLGMEPKLPPDCLLQSLFKQIPCLEYVFYIGCGKDADGWREGSLRDAELGEEKQRLKILLEPYFSRINHINLVTGQPSAYADFEEYIYEEYGIPAACMYSLEKRMGREGKTVILDARADYKIPWTAIPEGACYVDFWSIEKKAEFLGKMRRDVRYMSVVKFLDTLVKNGYNTIVN